MDIEKFLKDILNIEKEAWATAEAIQGLYARENAESLIEKYSQDLTHMEEMAMTATKIINTLPEDDVKRIFAARYLHKMTWEETADAAFLSVTHAKRLHKKGIAWLEENYKS